MKKKKSEALRQDVLRATCLLKNAQKNKLRREFTQEENLLICKCIVQDEEFASDFFYKFLAPMTSGFVYKIKKDYKVDVLPHDVATIIYTEIYNRNRWTRLTSFQGHCSIYTWVARAAAQVLIPRLRDEGIIQFTSGRTEKTTSLTLKSMKNKEERQLLIDLVDVSQWHDVLTCVYVKGMSMGETMRELNMTEDLFKNTLTTARKSLKDQLIAQDSYYWRRKDGKMVNLVSLALRDHAIVLDSIDTEEGMELADNVLDDDALDARREVLNIIYPGEPFKVQWHKFVFDHAMQMKWSVEKETVWIGRYCDGVPSKVLAKRLGRNATWVDNTYSRLNKELAVSIRAWWKA